MFFNELKNSDDYLKRLMILIAYIIIFVGTFYILNIIKPLLIIIVKVFTPFALGLILAYIFDPIISFFQKKLRLPRFTGLIVFYLLIVIIVSLFFLLILPEIFSQTIQLIEGIKKLLPEKIELLRQKFNIPINQEEIKKFLEKLDIGQAEIEQAAGALAPEIKDVASSGLSAAGSIAKSIASGIGYFFSLLSVIIFIIIINFYFLLDFSKIKPIVEKIIPQKYSPRAMDLLGKIDVAVGGFIRGQAIDCTIIGLLTTLALLIMGFKKYAILIGFITGVGNAIPYLGPLLGGIPSVLWIIFSDAYQGLQEKLVGVAILIGVFAVIQAIDGFILQPKVVGKNSQLHPLAVLLALYIGSQFGISGMIIAIPVACIIRVLLKELWWNKLIQDKENKSSAST